MLGSQGLCPHLMLIKLLPLGCTSTSNVGTALQHICLFAVIWRLVGRLMQLSAMVQGLPSESVHSATSLGGGEEAGGLCSQAAGS